MITQVESEWRTIVEFPNYAVDQFGNIYNERTNRLMRTSSTQYGHEKIALVRDERDEDGNRISVRHTRSVALLVATAFVDPPDESCDHVIVLDGNLRNVCANNLAWRPRSFAYHYFQQLREQQPIHYRNLSVANITTNIEYDSIIQAGMAEGFLFQDIWRSTYTGNKVYPNDSRFEITERV